MNNNISYNIDPIKIILCFVCHLLVLISAVSVAATTPANSALKEGDILVAEAFGGTNREGALVKVDPKTGNRSVISDFGDGAQGPLGANCAAGLAVEPKGNIYVLDFCIPGIFKIDPNTGNRTLLNTNFGVDVSLFYGLAVSKAGDIYVDAITSTPEFTFRASLLKVDPITGESTVISDLGDTTQGRPSVLDSDFQAITELALDEASGKIIVNTASFDFATPPLPSFVVSVDIATGNRTIISNLHDPALGSDDAETIFSTGLAVHKSGDIFVNSSSAFKFPSRHLVLRVNRKTGQRKVVTDFDNPAQGIQGISPRGLAIEKNGNLIVSALSFGNPFIRGESLYRINPSNGKRIILSNKDNAAQGPVLKGIATIQIYPLIK
jgi:outer membrane protein assembly factor BamB